MDQKRLLQWKVRRIAAGLRQFDLAARAGMSASKYSAIERGDLEPTIEDRANIERALPPLPREVFPETKMSGALA